MLSNEHFYHRITRKLVVAFGTMFNNLRLVRYNLAGTVEIERVTVPLTYSPKEKFYTRITQDPALNRQMEIALPRMSFELDSITYDPLRKISSFQKQFSADGAGVKSGYQAPYNFNFTLQIYVRNTEDGTQLIEQILPYFNPDYTVTMYIASVGKPVDVPIILETVSYNVENDTGGADALRMLIWTLTFTAKAYLYGPITSAANSKIIRKVTANTYIDNSEFGDVDRKLTFNTGSGLFKVGELVYQGDKLEEATMRGYVLSAYPSANQIVVNDITGGLTVNSKVHGAITNAAWNLSSYEQYDNQIMRVAIYPDLLSANANDDFGFTEVMQQFPYINNDEYADATVTTADTTTLSVDNT
jgi:hypothetical protein